MKSILRKHLIWLVASIILSLHSDGRSNVYGFLIEEETRQEIRSSGELGPPPGRYEFVSENERIIIPFEFHRNKFRFKAIINGCACNMLLDNGSLWDELLFFGSPKIDSIAFEITGETTFGNTKADRHRYHRRIQRRGVLRANSSDHAL